MHYTDLHCDTVTRCYKESKSFLDGDLQINAVKSKGIENYEQFFALWLNDEPKGETAFSLCENILDYYDKEIAPVIKGYPNIKPHLSIENASALGDDLHNIAYFKERGVEMMSLTWNGENDLASGVNVKGGLKSLGRQAVKEMARLGITVDVSHLNERSFYEVCLIDSIKIVASHSNCYDICNHRRNLKRWQVKELISRGGLIGLNFCKDFFEVDNKSGIDSLMVHLDYLLEKGCEAIIAFGTDFDGCELSDGICGIESIESIYNSLLKSGYKEELLNKLFYNNANCFFKNMIQ